jgi:hypothetical protein
LAETKAAKAATHEVELRVKLAEAIRASTEDSASAKTPVLLGTAHLCKKSKGTAGSLTMSTAAQHHVYQSPQRKAMTANKWVAFTQVLSF